MQLNDDNEPNGNLFLYFDHLSAVSELIIYISSIMHLSPINSKMQIIR